MTDAKTLAYINLFGILGALENLCELDEEAQELLKGKKPISIGIEVKGGPSATLTFKNSRCRMEEGCRKDCDVKLPFSSCEKFNGLIDGTVTPIPSKGFIHIPFLLKQFTGLTDILTKYLRASEEDLKDEVFFEKSTKLMFYLITVAISQIANHDEIGKFSAHYVPDGIVEVAIKDSVAAALRVEDHHFVTIKQKPKAFRSQMQFGSIKLARDLFDGNVNALSCIGDGSIEMHGQINMIDNVNRILDRVALYLA